METPRRGDHYFINSPPDQTHSTHYKLHTTNQKLQPPTNKRLHTETTDRLQLANRLGIGCGWSVHCDYKLVYVDSLS